MNKIIILIVQGDEYNKTYEWNSVEEFTDALANNKDLPADNEIVIEAYIDDNLVDCGNEFSVTLNKLKLVLDINI